MSRKVFYSFHFDNDNWRAGQVRNMGVVEGNQPVSGNKWEEIKQSEASIKRWIDDNLKDKSCLIVLIGEKTSERKWVKYEIKRAWELGKAVCGIYIHNLKNVYGEQSKKGRNPFASFIPVFETRYTLSDYVYNDIKNNIANLVENAIEVRKQYK
ncbi:MTH538 TIR-like domain (DUF1863) [Porphyromonas crevioricanis]|uniref:MTH538 TIR-like domain (DUF1863) n=1 Tax=Porphyromonas crevioricanis TaxID=393921 RepID=A0A2X4PGG9_9PORP|nr:TIR domain-containing protein [Porphyromonas crevioricanis]GAD07525.1 hypothetical protein PORCAN_1146 [Porphyromonas crevioricanis JCM 13913]SQH72974.1 MTH538 TIR-like domain (DUF1863) [Porphyromonas crevioricanis]